MDAHTYRERKQKIRDRGHALLDTAKRLRENEGSEDWDGGSSLSMPSPWS
jgi:hypothetical protein